MSHHLLLVTIIASGKSAVFLDGRVILASDTIDDSTLLVKEVAKSISEALNVEIIEVKVNYLDKDCNWDDVKTALIANGTMLNGNAILPGIDGSFYQWLKLANTDEGLRHLHIEGDEVNLSELMFVDSDEAIEAIENNVWGWSPQEALVENFVLVKVSKSPVIFSFDSLTKQACSGTCTSATSLLHTFPSVKAPNDKEEIDVLFNWLKRNVNSGIFFSEDMKGEKTYCRHVLEAIAQSPDNYQEILNAYMRDWFQDNVDMESDLVFGFTFGGKKVDSEYILNSLVAEYSH